MWLPSAFRTTILRTANNIPTIVQAHRIKIHLVRPISGVAWGNWQRRPSGTDHSESSMANSDRLSHFGHRISLFLQTLVLRGILFREHEHRQERIGGGSRATNMVYLALPSNRRNVWRRFGKRATKLCNCSPTFD
jgi:hypothetical protein